MINCRIISVNTDNEDDVKCTQEFGHKTDDNGKKLRYYNRRKKILQFINNTSIDGVKFEIFNAVTPKDFIKEGNTVLFEGKSIQTNVESLFYIANTLSHYKIWNLEEDTLIIEDDLLFKQDKFKTIPALIEKFKEIKHISKVLYLQLTVPWKENALKKHFQIIPSEKYSDFGFPLNSDLSGTSCYFIEKETKKILLSNLKPLLACDAYLGLYNKEGIITYYIPKDLNLMMELDLETYWI